MDSIFESNAKVEQVRSSFDGTSARPRKEWVRGSCPKCGDDLVSNCYFVSGRGYLICWECWSSLSEKPTCDYRKVL